MQEAKKGNSGECYGIHGKYFKYADNVLGAHFNIKNLLIWKIIGKNLQILLKGHIFDVLNIDKSISITKLISKSIYVVEIACICTYPNDTI